MSVFDFIKCHAYKNMKIISMWVVVHDKNMNLQTKLMTIYLQKKIKMNLEIKILKI